MADRRSNSPSGPSRRRSNHAPARWRDTCRRDLARHISKSSLLGCSGSMAHISGPEQQLGLEVDPAEIRLVPSPTDPYAWPYSPEQEHLFRKQLSKHNVGAYRQICEHLGHSIQVVLRDGQPVRASTTRDMESGERSTLPQSRSPGSQSSQRCCHGQPEHTAQEVGKRPLVMMKLIKSRSALD